MDDASAYMAAGIPDARVFVVGSSGQVSVGGSRKLAAYRDLTADVIDLLPQPVSRAESEPMPDAEHQDEAVNFHPSVSVAERKKVIRDLLTTARQGPPNPDITSQLERALSELQAHEASYTCYLRNQGFLGLFSKSCRVTVSARGRVTGCEDIPSATLETPILFDVWGEDIRDMRECCTEFKGRVMSAVTVTLRGGRELSLILQNQDEALDLIACVKHHRQRSSVSKPGHDCHQAHHA
eukprot:CAMPEP_0175807020 /NCGR_PEP_ID=MMETSP0107_2-20121207/1500_1 /TAXON_ID=195067 ORGANISM="Goniomonas pacifica, Strain CCMP1869" /NCGR_SAMPLE_ID=MMETSP0107_2 /ASSEMBLY_ACC=CAM_ASM_000203 /LENGTH=237 /DNA_ID=CAMNT_0017118547 /DNA_START=77 /DNA_END=791 /DNA_ORIENTATION=-